MYFRCPECRSPNWTRFSERPGGPLECDACEREHPIRHARELGLTAPQRFATVMNFARTHGIDMPSACSILLGIMTLEQVAPNQDLRRARRDFSGNRSHTTKKARGPSANQRAAKLVQWYAMPKDLALEVANGRLTLQEALRQFKRPPAPQETSPERQPLRRRYLPVGTLLLLVVVGVGLALHGARNTGLEVDPALTAPIAPAAPLTSSSVFTDGEGRIIEIRGSSPEGVLIAYCENQRELALTPVEIATTLPPGPDYRIGIVQDISQPSVRYAIDLHRHGGPQAWSAGNGRDPIVLTPAPVLPPDTPTVPVGRRR